MINFKDIFDSWNRSFNPTEQELKHSKDRLEVCKVCEYKQEVFKGKEWSLLCTACGCPLQKKIYSKVTNACPKGKWEKVDEQNGQITLSKKNKTLL